MFQLFCVYVCFFFLVCMCDRTTNKRHNQPTNRRNNACFVRRSSIEKTLVAEKTCARQCPARLYLCALRILIIDVFYGNIIALYFKFDYDNASVQYMPIATPHTHTRSDRNGLVHREATKICMASLIARVRALFACVKLCVCEIFSVRGNKYRN